MAVSTGPKSFNHLVNHKFNLYNSLFLNLPYRDISNIGMLIPLLQQSCREGLQKGISPNNIIQAFFQAHTNVTTEKEQIDFMFRVVQYVERQVVLYDSIEDAAFKQLQDKNEQLKLRDFLHEMEHSPDKEALFSLLSSFSTRLVFTAHPTQFYPPFVLDIISDLRMLIAENRVDEIDMKLQQLGLTSLINSKKPTPLDEARNIMYYLRHIYYDAVGTLFTELKKNISNNFSNYNILQLGFWPGGDRDGNPFVTASITADVADELRMTLMKCYYKDIKQLEQKLTFRKVDDILSAVKDKLYAAMFDRTSGISFSDISTPLTEIRSLLIHDYNSLFLTELDQLLDKVRIFRTHFASLDIRQNHAVHHQLMEAILERHGLIAEGVDALNEQQFIEMLSTPLALHPADYDDALLKDTLESISLIQKIQNKNGEAGCHRYIISNSEDVWSVLFVFALLRWEMGIDADITVDIVPLFESMEGMRNAEEIMRTLFDMPVYRKHLAGRNNEQTIMLGFSDGTKDGGYLEANWSIFKIKETLSSLCAEYGITVLFFDGRGGPPARGGGKTHQFYASQSAKIANNAIQLTIQGQTITSKYGSEEQFIHHVELMIAAGLSQNLHVEKNLISEKNRQLIDKLGAASLNKYQALKQHPSFIPYLEKKSTLKYYSAANIGSRPAKRGSKSTLELEDLRAISYVGSWSQLKQNVPGYFGLGTAIHNCIEDGYLDDLKSLYQEVPFFRALIQNSMMSLLKCNFDLTRFMAEDTTFGPFWKLLEAEFILSTEMVLLISGDSYLMEEDHVTRESIAIRESIVLPLLLIQQFSLQQLETDNNYSEQYEKLVQRSLYGNINASRNSV